MTSKTVAAGMEHGPEHELRRDRALLHAIVEASTDGILNVDANGFILFASPAACRIFGYSLTELTGLPIAALMPESRREHYRACLDDFRQKAITEFISAGREGEGLRKNGEIFPIDVSVAASDTEEGPVFTAILRDATSRREAEAVAREKEAAERAVRENEERMNGILTWLQDVIFSIDKNYERHLYISAAVEQIFGVSRQMFYEDARQWRKAIHPEDRDRALVVLEGFREEGVLDAEFRIIRPDGQVRWIHLAGCRVTDATGETVRYDGIARDVTERKTAELRLIQAMVEAEQANKAKTLFLSRMSHELRTPMNAILGFGQLLEISDLDDRQREGIGHIMKAGRHLLHLIDEVLQISRIEMGSHSLSVGSVDLSALLRECVDLVTPQALERELSLRLKAETHLWAEADPLRSRQVILNLLSNAIKYNVRRGSIMVTAVRDPAEGVVIEVRDSGLGISQEMLPRLFTPFDRLDAESSGIEGTGLGLALSKSLVEAMGGRLSVTSKKGEGSTFRIVLRPAHSVRVCEPALDFSLVGPPSCQPLNITASMPGSS